MDEAEIIKNEAEIIVDKAEIFKNEGINNQEPRTNTHLRR